MTTTNTTPANDATVWLEAHGFTGNPGSRRYHHPSGYVVVELVDDEAACFTIHAFTRDRARLVLWQAQLTHAPLAVFAATVTAAYA